MLQSFKRAFFDIPFILTALPGTKSLSGVGAFCLLLFPLHYIERATTLSFFDFSVSFISLHNGYYSPSGFTTSSASSLSGDQSDLQSHFREAEAFI